jgi:sRNA-binding protein
MAEIVPVPGYSHGSMSETTPLNTPPTEAGPAPSSDPKRRAPLAGKPGARGAQGQGPRAPRPVHPLLQRLWELHPRLFGARFRPLKLGIFEDLMSRHPDAFQKEDLKQALGQHVRSTRYLEAVAGGDLRHDLDGNPVEPVAPEHVQHAILEVFRRRQGRDAEAARTWARARLVQAIDASGLDRDAYLERVHTQDATALALVDEAWAQLADQAARREALLRAYRASGQPLEAFADMYGLDVALVRDALAREPAGSTAVSP